MNPEELMPTVAPSFVDLNVQIEALAAEQDKLMRSGCPYDPQLSELDNAIRQRDHQERIKQLVKEQLALLASLRKTATGPAKAGGKRAKRAPIDLEALENAVFD